jgi:hypothetical protein
MSRQPDISYDVFILNNYFKLSAKSMAEQLGCHRSKINRRIKALGLPAKKGHPDSLASEEYTPEELRLILTSGHTRTHKEVAHIIGRTENAVRKKSLRMQVDYRKQDNYSPYEDEYIAFYYGVKTYTEIGRELGRTYEGVRARARLLGVTGTQEHHEGNHVPFCVNERR